jgi:hypothetical protein
MRELKIALPIAILGLALTAFGQDSNAPPPSKVPPQDVIVPWRHFGPPAGPASPSEPGESRTPSAGTAPGATPASNPSANADASSAQPQESGAKITEEDISKRHPHPPQPLQLPAADQNSKPLVNKPGESGDSAGLTAAGGSNAASPAVSGSALPAGNSAESEVASLTAGYKQREADREARRRQLEQAVAKDPANAALAQIQGTRLLLEGEQDRSQSAQQLSAAFSELADELASRASQVRSMAEGRKQMAEASDAELDRLNARAPQLELALRNVAMLPPSDENNQLIRRLDAELAQNDQARKADQARSLQARHEMQSLTADAEELEREAAEARRKSADFAKAAKDARLNENRLADRLEYSVTRQRASDILDSTSKAIQSSVALTGNNNAINSAVLGSAASVQSKSAVDRLRDCIRKSGDVEACRAKGE